MAVIADLVVKVRADWSTFDKQVKTKLGRDLSGGRGSGVGAGGKSGFKDLFSMLGIKNLTIVGLALSAILVIKKAVQTMATNSAAFQAIKSTVSGALGTAVDTLVFLFLSLFKSVDPVTRPLLDFVNTAKLIVPAFFKDVGMYFTGQLDYIKLMIAPVLGTAKNAMVSLSQAFDGFYLVVEPMWRKIQTSLGLTLGSTMGLINDVLSTWNKEKLFEDMGTSLGYLASIFSSLTSGQAGLMLTEMSLALGWLVTYNKLFLVPMAKVGGFFLEKIARWMEFLANSSLQGYNFLIELYRKMLDFFGVTTKAEDYKIKEAPKDSFELFWENFDKGLYDENWAKKIWNLLLAGFSKEEIYESQADYWRSKYAREKAKKYNVEETGGMLFIPSDYWGDTYTDQTTGSCA